MTKYRAIKTTLALDIATKTGWALSDGTSGVQDFSEYTHDYGRMGHVFAGWLSDKVAEHDVYRLVIERNAARGKGSNDYHLIGLCFTAHRVGWQHDLERTEWTRQSYATAFGFPVSKRLKAGREAVIKWARSQGFDPADDNEADALALLTYDLQQAEQAA